MPGPLKAVDRGGRINRRRACRCPGQVPRCGQLLYRVREEESRGHPRFELGQLGAKWHPPHCTKVMGQQVWAQAAGVAAVEAQGAGWSVASFDSLGPAGSLSSPGSVLQMEWTRGSHHIAWCSSYRHKRDCRTQSGLPHLHCHPSPRQSESANIAYKSPESPKRHSKERGYPHSWDQPSLASKTHESPATHSSYASPLLPNAERREGRGGNDMAIADGTE